MDEVPVEAPKSPGQIAYEEDCERRPAYDYGEPRREWSQISKAAQSSWENDPAPRDFFG